jgi:hypothetical protein
MQKGATLVFKKIANTFNKKRFLKHNIDTPPQESGEATLFRQVFKNND